MGSEPGRHDDSAIDDVAGHLRMTDEQLASGTTPRDVHAEVSAKPTRDGGDDPAS